ncbi:hypothetical protein BC829DRAFT_379200 [Chytridium lagenaria]|nr:hypothetical protein BC829DRAFT_379200 [Chytridium lagenaria]
MVFAVHSEDANPIHLVSHSMMNSRHASEMRANTAPQLLRPISRLATTASSDGKKIAKDDVKQALDQFFPTLSGRLLKLFNLGKAEMTKEALVALLLNRGSPQDHFDEVFEMFEPGENGAISDSTLLRITRELNKYTMPSKSDMAAIKNRFDRDKDGEIGYEDFKRMNMRPLAQ